MKNHLPEDTPPVRRAIFVLYSVNQMADEGRILGILIAGNINWLFECHLTHREGNDLEKLKQLIYKSSGPDTVRSGTRVQRSRTRVLDDGPEIVQSGAKVLGAGPVIIQSGVRVLGDGQRLSITDERHLPGPSQNQANERG